MEPERLVDLRRRIGFAILSKYLIRYRGRHIFNPSNVALVACFLVLGEARAEPLDFWWGPMSLVGRPRPGDHRASPAS